MTQSLTNLDDQQWANLDEQIQPLVKVLGERIAAAGRVQAARDPMGFLRSGGLSPAAIDEFVAEWVAHYPEDATLPRHEVLTAIALCVFDGGLHGGEVPPEWAELFAVLTPWCQADPARRLTMAQAERLSAVARPFPTSPAITADEVQRILDEAD